MKYKLKELTHIHTTLAIDSCETQRLHPRTGIDRPIHWV